MKLHGPWHSAATFLNRANLFRPSAFLALFTLATAFGLLDLSTSFLALAKGMSEGNVLVLALARSSGINVMTALEAAKVAFILGCGAACMIGVKLRSSQTQALAFSVLALFAVVQAAASLSNILQLI
ncbi:MAG TPA: hypothetical protein VLX56_05720 [Nitrososphaerales archaeon]|nr:hypothetical protein [Nitrososphaerales archaeon]